jgi:hypothetical protein
MGLRLTNLKDLRDSNESGLKRVSLILVLCAISPLITTQFWGTGNTSKAAGKAIAEEDDSSTDDELGLWEVDPQGEPVTPSRQIPSEANYASTGPSAVSAPAPEASKKAPTLKQSKLPVSRGSVPLVQPSTSKRKRSASVGSTYSIIDVDEDIRWTESRRDSTPALTLSIIDVDLVCPRCLRETGSDEQHSEICFPKVQSSRVKGGRAKRVKLAPLFCQKRR